MNRSRAGRLAPFLVASLLALTSCENGNLFGKLHKPGDSSDAKTLNSDAAIALTNKNYASAYDLAIRVLNQDPNNSQALLTAAAAQIGLSGLSIGTLIANILNNTGTPSSSSITGMADFISRARERVTAQGGGSGSLLAGIDLEELNTDIDPAICRLRMIVSGEADGVIKADDPSVRINLAILCLIRAVLRPLRAGYLDVRNDGNTFSVVVIKDPTLLCTTDSAILNQMGSDVAAAYYLLNSVVDKLGLDSDRVITKLRDDIAHYGEDFLTTGSSVLPQACLDTLNAPPANINVTNFQNKQDILTPPTSC